MGKKFPNKVPQEHFRPYAVILHEVLNKGEIWKNRYEIIGRHSLAHVMAKLL